MTHDKQKHSSNRSLSSFENLEARRLMSGTSIPVGNVLFTVEDGPSVGSPATPSALLYRSNLDGSDRQMLRQWSYNTNGPANLFAYGDKLIFSASYRGESYDRPELWASDGTPTGTKQIAYVAGSAHGINPHDYHIIDGRLVFLGDQFDLNDKLKVWTTDGTAEGTHQLIGPEANSDYARYDVTNVIFGTHYVQATDQSRTHAITTFITDGTVEGTHPGTLPAGEVITLPQDPDSGGDAGPTTPTPRINGHVSNGVLRVYGTSFEDRVSFSGSVGNLTVTVNQVSTTFSDPLSTIIVDTGRGDDRIDLRGAAFSTKIYAGADDDTVFGGSGKDRIYGSDGNDWISGGDNHDTLYGSAGNDTLFGDGGHDFVSGGEGLNVLRGGAGVDHVVFVRSDNYRDWVGDKLTQLRMDA